MTKEEEMLERIEILYRELYTSILLYFYSFIILYFYLKECEDIYAHLLEVIHQARIDPVIA